SAFRRHSCASFSFGKIVVSPHHRTLVVFSFTWRCLSRRNQTDRISSPRIDNNENAPERIHRHHHEAVFRVTFFVGQGYRVVVLKGGCGIRKFYPVLREVLAPLRLIPLEIQCESSICTSYARSKMRGITRR